MEEYVEAAIERGLSEICFADHIPLPDNFDADHRMSLKEMETYMDQIALVKRKYREISILVGIEADYIEGLERYYDKFLSSFPFDLVIMSIHFLKRWPRDQWVFEYKYNRTNIKEKYSDYFNAMVKGIKTGLFDIVGHMDLIKRPRFSVMYSNQRDVERVIKAASQAGMSIELNTSGLHKPINDLYPSLEIIELAIERGVPFIFSSDAHSPEEVGFCFDELLNYMFNYPGFKLATYQKRESTSQKLQQPVENENGMF
jgi:histidinol-phosphatase (PHP family)